MIWHEHVANNDTSIENCYSVRIMHVAMFLLARQNFFNGSLPNLPVDMVATDDGLYNVGVHQADYYDLVSTYLLASS